MERDSDVGILPAGRLRAVKDLCDEQLQQHQIPSAARYAWTWDHWNNAWSLDNRTGLWPRLAGSGGNREETAYWLDDMTYLRLKNIQLGYSVPSKILRRLHINSFRIFGSAENLATITNYRGLDPELTGNRSNAYPLNKSYSAGINIGL